MRKHEHIDDFPPCANWRIQQYGISGDTGHAMPDWQAPPKDPEPGKTYRDKRTLSQYARTDYMALEIQQSVPIYPIVISSAQEAGGRRASVPQRHVPGTIRA